MLALQYAGYSSEVNDSIPYRDIIGSQLSINVYAFQGRVKGAYKVFDNRNSKASTSNIVEWCNSLVLYTEM